MACRLASEFGVGRGVLELILCHGGCDGFLGIHDTGNVWTASAHVITAVIGSGVLSLAWSIAQMGWLMGPVVLLLFAVVTYFTSMLLADSYRHPDPVTGKRNYTYMDTVRANLGESTDSTPAFLALLPVCMTFTFQCLQCVYIVVLAACKLVAEAWLISWSMKFVTVCESYERLELPAS